MGLKFYIGASGSGKSYQLYNNIIEESLKNPDRNYLIVVPDQFTMQTQLEMVKRHPNNGIMNIDVLSFGRLSHRIFEEVGGNEKPVLDDTGKSLVLRRVAAELEDKLGTMKNNVRKLGYISEVKSAISEFMQYGLGINEVGKLCEYASKRKALGGKLKDLHILYEGFLKYIDEKFITTEETLDILKNVLPKSRVVKDSVIVFDGFTGFTPVQNNVIQELMILASEVIITITMDTRENPYMLDEEQKLFHLSKKTISDLLRLAKEAKVAHDPKRDIKISDDIVYRYKDNHALAHLERELFRSPYKTFDNKNNNSVFIAEMSNPQEEIRQVCLKIKELVRNEGYSYREIALITGDIERYAFVAEEEFEHFNIPYFIDQNNKLVLNPFVEFIRSALLIIIQDYSYEAMFHFLRCGLADITPEETDRLENYIMMVGIRGKAKWSSKFTRHAKKNEEDAAELEELNGLREKIVDKLEMLNIKKATGKVFVQALYDFILKAGIEEKLKEYEDFFISENEPVKAKEYGQIYRLVMELLDQIYALMGDEELEIKEFAQILDAGFAEIKVGSIPQTVDKIVLGDIERTRLAEIKALFFIGVNDGIIPKGNTAGGIISNIDREFLQDSEFELAPTPRQQMYIQKFYLYMIMTKPSQKLFLSYSKVDNEGKSIRPSYLINTVKKLYPGIETKYPQLAPVESQLGSSAEGLQQLIDMLRRYAAGNQDMNKKYFFTLYDKYVQNEKYASVVEQMKAAAFGHINGVDGAMHTGLSKELARLLYGQVLHNSVSRLEKFASCAYAHFLKYGIELSERDKYSFESVDIGNIFHAVLESFGEELTEEGYTWFDFPKETGERLVGECLQSYVDAYGENVLYSTERNKYMINRMHRILNRTVDTLQYQLKQGAFTPESFELSFSMTSDLEAVNISLSEEEKMRLIGRIDRIDTCQKNDKLYVKVIDYKSGNKKFDLAALYYGLQLQLVVYMNAALESQKKQNPDKDVVPAAMLYYHVNDPMTETEKGKPDPYEIQKAILDELKMTGIVSDDEETILLLDKEFESKSNIIPVARKKDGSFTAASSVLSRDDFGTVSKYVNHKIKEIGSSILSGNIDLNPYEQSDTSACTYCAFKGVCGFDKKLSAGMIRHLDDLNQEEAMELIKNQVNRDLEGKAQNGGEV